MKGLAILTIVCLSYTVSMVAAMTNVEFLNFMTTYGTDIEFLDEDYVDFDNDWDSADVIDITGSSTDEVDLEPALKILFNDLDTDLVYNEDSSVLELEQEDEGSNLGGFRCKCRKGSCECCGSKTFKAKIFWRRVKFTLRACVKVALSRRGAAVTITVNGRKVLGKSITLRNPPGLCFGVPGLKRFAKVCLNLYNIDIRRKRMCLKLTGKIDLKIKKFKVNIKLGCITIPKVDEDVFGIATHYSDVLAEFPLDDEQ